MTDTDEKPLLTAPKAAKILNLTNGRIRQLARAGKLDAVKYGPIWLISRQSVEAYQAARVARQATRPGGER